MGIEVEFFFFAYMRSSNYFIFHNLHRIYIIYLLHIVKTYTIKDLYNNENILDFSIMIIIIIDV